MATTIQTQRLRSRLKVISAIETGAGAAAELGGPIMDMKSYKRVLFHCTVPTTNTNGQTKIEIVASAASGMTSVVAVREIASIDMDAADDQVNIEVDHLELAQLSAEAGLAVGAGYRYVQVRATHGGSGDKVVVVAIGEPWEEKDGLTPATTIA